MAFIAEYDCRMFVANNENVGRSIMKAIANTYGWAYIYVMYVCLSIFTPVFALDFVVLLMEHDGYGFTSSG